LLTENTFLKGFINHEVVSLMAVIMTVTLASVANIHLAINRLVAVRLQNVPALRDAASEVKNEVNDNAWLIFGGFVAAVLTLIVGGAFASSIYVGAGVNAVVLWILALFITCMYDIYRVVFGIVALEFSLGTGINPAIEEFTTDAPRLDQ
jgi:hypothetical protein